MAEKRHDHTYSTHGTIGWYNGESATVYRCTKPACTTVEVQYKGERGRSVGDWSNFSRRAPRGRH